MRSVQFQPVDMEVGLGTVVNTAVEAARVALTLPKEEEGGDEAKEDILVVVTTEVSIGPITVILSGEKISKLDELESDELVGRKLEKPVAKALEELVRKELDRFVGIAELSVMVADEIQDVGEVSAEDPEVVLIIGEDKESTALLDETMELSGGILVIPELFLVAPAEVEFVKGGRQHEDEREVPPPSIAVMTALDEIDTNVGMLVMPFASKVEFDVGAQLLEDG